MPTSRFPFSLQTSRVLLCASASLLALGGAGSAHAQTYTFSTLASFNGTNGSYLDEGVTLDSAGNIYGTTLTGGANSAGTVYKIAAGTSTITTIASFTGANGLSPQSRVTFDSAGNLYGTTYYGGSTGNGTVYKIDAGTNIMTTLTSFTGTNGANPRAGITLDSTGNLYGTTSYGAGSTLNGTVFEIAAGTNAFTTLTSFNGTNGSASYSGVIFDSAGNMYGTTSAGGANSKGTVFKIAAGTNIITTLATFTGTNGNTSYGQLTLDSAGNLYGTTEYGGAKGVGTIFKIDAGTSNLTTLYSFDTTNGENPMSGVTLDSAGNIYGTAYSGGTNNKGVVYKIDAGTNAFTTLYTFNGTDGSSPYSALTFDSAGNIYGTTNQGGASNLGTVFKLTLNDTVSATAPEPGSLALLLGTAGLPIVGILRKRRYDR